MVARIITMSLFFYSGGSKPPPYTSSVGFADTFPKGKANDVAKLRDVLRCEKSYLNLI